jgi:hypothetical protein
VLLGAAATLQLAGEEADADDGVSSHQALLDQLRAARMAAAADARALVRAARTTELPARQWLVLGSILTDIRRLVAELGTRSDLTVPVAKNPLRHQGPSWLRNQGLRDPRS